MTFNFDEMLLETLWNEFRTLSVDGLTPSILTYDFHKCKTTCPLYMDEISPYVFDIHLEHSKVPSLEEFKHYENAFAAIAFCEPSVAFHYHGKLQVPDSLQLGNYFIPVYKPSNS